MAATIKDLARETGLGLATISSYLNGGNVRERNRVVIEAAIKKYDFHVNETARSLKTKRTMSIGVIVPELKSNFFANIITEAEDILRHHGYSVLVSDCRTNPRHEKESVEFLMSKRVDGLINAPVDNTGAHLEPFFKSGKAVVLIDRKVEGLLCDSVSIDNVNAIRKAVRHLAERGHRVIGYIGGPMSVYTAAQRRLGYRIALEELGLPVDEGLAIESDYTIQGGRDATHALLRAHSDMTAIITTNDEMTVGCMIAVNELCIRIPENLSVIGFDNLDFAHACQPPLTIISQPSVEIAHKAAELMLGRLAGGNGPAQEIKLESILNTGRSTKYIV